MFRAHVTQWLERRWYGSAAPNAILRGLSALFARIVAARRRRFLAAAAGGANSQVQRAAVPVILVGNLAVGGAGKTPLVIALVEALRKRGFRPGVIARGYGRLTTQLRRVRLDSTPSEVGDEPLLIARRTAAPVAVAARRIEAARLLVASGEVDVLIGDDGLQHYRLARDIEILVIDGQRRFGNGLLLPAGPLREPVARAKSCDFIVCNGGTAQADEVPMGLQLAQAVPLAGDTARTLASFAGERVHAVAGIGHPERFFSALRALGLDVVPHGFADHHRYVAGDFEFGDEAVVLMTEKDAVKCAEFARPNWYVVPVDAVLPESFFDAVAARLATAQGANV